MNARLIPLRSVPPSSTHPLGQNNQPHPLISPRFPHDSSLLLTQLIQPPPSTPPNHPPNSTTKIIRTPRPKRTRTRNQSTPHQLLPIPFDNPTDFTQVRLIPHQIPPIPFVRFHVFLMDFEGDSAAGEFEFMALGAGK